MIVHSCCCIGVFVMLGLIQIQNPFENFFGKSFENLLQLKRLKVRLFFGATFFGLLLPSGHAIPRAIEKETTNPAIPACFEGNKLII